MVHHLAESYDQLIPPSPGPRPGPDEVQLGFSILVDGDPKTYFESAAPVSPHHNRVYRPVAEKTGRFRAKAAEPRLLQRPQPPTTETLASPPKHAAERVDRRELPRLSAVG
jgi:hypothetical protein